LRCGALLLLFVGIQNTSDFIQALTCRRPIAIPAFIKHFWWCFNNLKEYADAHPGMPAYFRFMTILGETLSLQCTHFETVCPYTRGQPNLQHCLLVMEFRIKACC